MRIESRDNQNYISRTRYSNSKEIFIPRKVWKSFIFHNSNDQFYISVPLKCGKKQMYRNVFSMSPLLYHKSFFPAERMYVNAHCRMISSRKRSIRIASELAEKAIQPARNVKIVYLTISPALSTSKHFLIKRLFAKPRSAFNKVDPFTRNCTCIYTHTYIYKTYFNICHFTSRNDRVKRFHSG